MFGGTAVLHHVLPPGVGTVADAHVVWHRVEDEPHAGPVQFGHQSAEILLRAQLRVDGIVVNDVVAVDAAGARSQDRRSVAMGHAQRLQVGNQAARMLEAEVTMKLKAISGKRPRGTLLLPQAVEALGDRAALFQYR